MDGRIHDVLFKKRIVYLNDRITEKEATRIGDAIIALNVEGDGPITLYINSGGGNVDAALAIYDMLQHSEAPITGIVQQKAYSGASLVLQGCKTRKALKHAQILIHNGTVAIDRKVDEIQEDSERVIREAIETSLKRRAFMYAIYAEKTRKSVEEIKKICFADKAVYADEALTLGLIDEII